VIFKRFIWITLIVIACFTGWNVIDPGMRSIVESFRPPPSLSQSSLQPDPTHPAPLSPVVDHKIQQPWQILSPIQGLFTNDSLANPQLRELAAQLITRYQTRQKTDAGSLAGAHQGPTRGTDAAGAGYEFMGIQNGRYKVLITLNRNAAISVGADQVRRTPPFDVDGGSLIAGIWDQGSVRVSHQEFATNRVSVRDGASAYDHSTHVGGTIAALGIQATAMGMAPALKLDSYDWNSDFGEMTDRAQADPAETNGIRISNHSYGAICGWYGNSWYGTWNQGFRESDFFGAYDEDAATLDALCYNAPYYLPFQATGNDRDDSAPSSGSFFQYFQNGTWQYKTYNPATDPLADGADNGGYDTIITIANAKNCVTVGSVSDAVIGGLRSTNGVVTAGYSGWGPSDDGRIKPDLVANGESLYSPSAAGNSSYTTMSGTSMATPNAAGAAALLLDWVHRIQPNWMPRAATLKALLIHSADDLGRHGPDYSFGWGLINTRAAAQLIRLQTDLPDSQTILEDTLSVTQTLHIYTFTGNPAAPIKATLVWTDPPGTPTNGLDIRNPNLVNDLNLKVIGPTGLVALPWTLDPLNPALPAGTGTNRVDNVEQVRLNLPTASGAYHIIVSTDQPLQGGSQAYSLILDGIGLPPRIQHHPLENTVVDDQPYIVSADITPDYLLDPATAQIHWSPDETAGIWFTQTLSPLGSNHFVAQIPAQTCGTHIAYFLSATASNGFTATHPPGAPDQLHRFDVTIPLTLDITGDPTAIGGVTPGYGAHQIASGRVVSVSAPLYTPALSGSRFRCSGWKGSGSIPDSGSSNEFIFTLRQNSDLTWKWTPQFELAYLSNPRGLIASSTWSDADATVTPLPAPAILDSANTRYAFAGWYRDGLRQPNTNQPAFNPVPPFTLQKACVLYARYLQENKDSDSDGLPDWWELFFFGSYVPEPAADPDGDGFDNQAEYQDCSNPQSETSIPGPPTFLHTPLASPQNRPSPWTVSTVITDSCQVAQARVAWRRNNSEPWTQSTLVAQADSNRFSGSIDGPGVNGNTIEYTLWAIDSAGHETEIGPFFFDVSYPIATFTPTQHQNVLAEYGSSPLLPLVVSNSGLADLHWTSAYETCPLSDSVENSTSRWTHGGANDLWHISTNRAFSGIHSWYLGNSLTRSYIDRINASIISPAYTLKTNPQLHFQHWIRTEPDSATHFWDGGVVEISTNDGATFVAIPPLGGYPYRITPNTASPFPANMPCFAGTGGWQSVQFDLSAYVGQTIRFRFRFGSDGAVVDEGWFIDDIRLTMLCDSNASWFTCWPAAGTVAANTVSNFEIRILTPRLNPLDDREGTVRFTCNDPIASNHTSHLPVKVRTRPVLSALVATQSSTDGEGWVTFSQQLAGADGLPCDIRIEYTTDPGGAWSPATVMAATAQHGVPVISPDSPTHISGAACSSNTTPITNTVTAIWNTRAALPPIRLESTIQLRTTAWNGFFQSAPLTSQPFQVDNEPPDSSSASLSFNSSPFGPYVVGSTVTGCWSGFSDAGSGITNYFVSHANRGGTTNGIPILETHWTRTDVAPGPCSWFVWARDPFGNIGTAITRSLLILDPNADSDGDGLTALQEESAGTDATDVRSSLRFDGPQPLQLTSEGFALQWLSVSGRCYSLFFTNNLAEPSDPWVPVDAFQQIPSTGGLMRWTDTEPPSNEPRYYRIGVSPP
jgi:hypothetical protein